MKRSHDERSLSHRPGTDGAAAPDQGAAAPLSEPTTEPAESDGLLRPEPRVAERIESIVADVVRSIASLDLDGDEYRRLLRDVNAIGEREIVATSEMSGRFLDRPGRALGELLEGRTPLARSLAELRHTVEELNPARYDLENEGSRHTLGVRHGGDRVRDYFERYEKAQEHIEGLVRELEEGRSELERDNAAVAMEQKSLRLEIAALREYAFLAERLDEELAAAIESIAIEDADRARVLQEDVLYPVRRRRQEILTQLAVAAQGAAALQIVEQNNREVIRAIARAATTTVAALRTAVTVARAAANRRLVSRQLEAANRETAAMLEASSALVRDQASAVAREANERGLDVGSLQAAWDDVHAALDTIDAFRGDALAAARASVRELGEQVERSRDAVARRDRGEPSGLSLR